MMMMMMMMMIITIMSFVYPRQYFEALMLVRVSKFLKQIIQIKLNRVKNCPTGLRQTSRLFTNMVEDLNSRQLRTNPASGQGGT